MKKKATQILLNKNPDLTDKLGKVITWNRAEGGKKHYSLIDYVELNKKELREKYLTFIYSLGAYKINERTVCESLTDSRGYSLWWMSSLAEKSHLNSPHLTDCLKLFALEKILVEKKIKSVLIFTEANKIDLLEAIKLLCKNLKIDFSIIPHRKPKKISVANFIHKNRPEIFSVALWLFRYLKLNWPLRTKKNVNWFSGSKSITIFSYFFNLNIDKCSKGIFYSNQWSELPEKFNQNNVKINWIHHFMTFNKMPNTKTALSFVNSFNTNSDKQGVHTFFESQLSFLLFIVVIKNYCKFFFKSFTYNKIKFAFKCEDSNVNLWPILKDDWILSTRGGVVIRNLMFIELVDKAIKKLPFQKNGLYLQENQYWERALIHAWRLYGHGDIIGVPHASINFWDMRYFDDERNFINNDPLSQPHPNYVALNGPIHKRLFIDVNYPFKNILEVEALRFLRYNNHQKSKDKKKVCNKSDKNNILVIGEFRLDPTLDMLHAIRQTKPDFNKVSISFKPHPACKINQALIRMPEVLITNESIDTIVQNFDLVVVAGNSTAALDIYYSHVDIIVYLGRHDLNLCPLEAISDCFFVRTSTDFNIALAAINENDKRVYNKKDFFWTEKNLPRWNLLIKKMGYLDD